MNPEDEHLSWDNVPELNKEFYAMRPWEHLRYRLLHLAALAGHREQFRALLEDGVRIGGLELGLTPTDGVGDISAEGQVAFIAAETEILIQHTCETLLRLWFAHRPDVDGSIPDCPWLSLARDRSFGKFRQRCDELQANTAADLRLPVA